VTLFLVLNASLGSGILDSLLLRFVGAGSVGVHGSAGLLSGPGTSVQLEPKGVRALWYLFSASRVQATNLQ
jgi:hypothetical protein